MSRALPRLRVSLHLGSFLTGVASPDRATRQCVTLIYTSNDFRCALCVHQEPFYGLPFSAHCGSFLLMPRGPTAAALLPSNVKPYFRRDIKLCFRRPRVHFHQGRFFFFKSLLRLFRHGGLVCRYLTSLLRLCRMGGGD